MVGLLGLGQFFKNLSIYGHGSYLLHVSQNIYWSSQYRYALGASIAKWGFSVKLFLVQLLQSNKSDSAE